MNELSLDLQLIDLVTDSQGLSKITSFGFSEEGNFYQFVKSCKEKYDKNDNDGSKSMASATNMNHGEPGEIKELYRTNEKVKEFLDSYSIGN